MESAVLMYTASKEKMDHTHYKRKNVCLLSLLSVKIIHSCMGAFAYV